MGRYTDTNGSKDRAIVRDGFVEIQERGNNNDDILWGSIAWDPAAPGGIGGALQYYKKSNGKTTYYMYDGKGDVTSLVNTDNTMGAVMNYDPFGNLTWESYAGTAWQPLYFSTKRNYGGGFLDFGYRFYAPWMGRWMSRDPLGEAGGLNLYGYVGNSPISKFDPDGQDYIDINVSLGFIGGLTGGVLISCEGIYPYFGAGLMTPPGGVAVTVSPDDPTYGVNGGGQIGYWIGGQIGWSAGQPGVQEATGLFWEAGFVTPGASATLMYAFGPFLGPFCDKPCE